MTAKIMRNLLTIVEPMPLTEVARPETVYHAAKVLRDAGYDLLGYGRHAEVYARHGSPWVVKLFSNEDRAYSWFVDYVRQNRCIHWPRFKGGVFLVTEDFSAVRMERLEDLDTGLGFALDRFAARLLSGASVEEARRQFDADPDFAEVSLVLLDALAAMIPAAVAAGFRVDLETPGNIMLRGITLVLTDPLG